MKGRHGKHGRKKLYAYRLIGRINQHKYIY
jgi:hypothetical protein